MRTVRFENLYFTTVGSIQYKQYNNRKGENNLYIKLNEKCGPMPNVMVALPNIGGALCSTPQSLADAH